MFASITEATTVFLLGFCLRLHLKQKTVHWRPQLEKKKRAQASGESPLAAHPWLLRGTLRVASAREDWTTFVAFFRAEEKNHR